MKKLLYIILFVHCAMNIDHCLSQVSQQWAVRYNGPASDIDAAVALALDPSGNVYVTGYSYGINGNQEDYATVKYNSAGFQQWVARHNGGFDTEDYATAIAVDGSGNVYITGSCSEVTGDDFVTIKYNSSGIVQWTKRYNGPWNSEDLARAITIWGGNVYVTGRSRSSLTNYDYVTVKYNSTGVEQWVQRYDAPGNLVDDPFSIAVDGSGNVYVTGESASNVTNYDYVTIKYNSAGVQQWIQRYNGPANDYDRANCIKVDGSGNVYVTGASRGSTSGFDYATIKYNSAGVQLWAIRYNGPASNYDQAFSLAFDSFGNVFVTGTSYGTSSVRDIATIKYSPLGFEQWVSRYNGPGNGDDNSYSVVIDNSGFVYVTGSSYGGPGFLEDYVTLKYNTNGIQQWVQRFNGPGNGRDAASNIAVDGSGNIYITGASYGGSGTGMYDYATIKYSQTVGINTISGLIPDAFSLEQNYPNPFNPTTRIRFDIPLNKSGQISKVRLTVYDILGNETAALIDKELQPGKYEVIINADNFSSGVYFYTLKYSEYTNTKKMMIIK